MTEPDDPFEAELAALRPHDVSPALRRHIADRLAARPRWPWAVALAGGLAAAGLAFLFLNRGGNSGKAPGGPPTPVPPVARAETLPMPLGYWRAPAGSPEALDALLDRHAGRAPRPSSPGGRVHVFPPYDVDLQVFLGDL